MRRLEQVGIVVGVLLGVPLPALLHPPPTVAGAVAVGLVAAAGLALVAWRSAPRGAATVSLGLLLTAFLVAPGEGVPDTGIVVLSAGFAVLALAWSGRAAVAVGVLAAAYVGVLVAIGSRDGSEVAPLVFTVPGYVAGTIFRLRRETADELGRRAAELEREQEALTELSVRQERRRIASELHDVVGHALSVLVIQAAAGQRLVGSAPERVEGTFGVIAESARRGAADLERLVELLGGGAGPDLSLVDDLVAHAVRTGLEVTYRLEGDPAGVPDRAAHLAHRLVQEGLTNALRHAPGAAVRIRVAVTAPGSAVEVSVENDAPTRAPALGGGGLGLAGLRERVRAEGGRFGAGPTTAGGWRLDASLPPALAS